MKNCSTCMHFNKNCSGKKDSKTILNNELICYETDQSEKLSDLYNKTNSLMEQINKELI